MDEPAAFDDPHHDPPVGPGRGRRILQATIIVALVGSMVFLAFISGRGVVTVVPDPAPRATVAARVAGSPRLAAVGTDGHLLTMAASGGSVTPVGRPEITFSFPAWSPDGSRIAVIGTSAGETAVDIFTIPDDGAAPSDPVVAYQSADRPPFYLYWAPDRQRLTFLTTEPSGLALRIAPADASAPASVLRTGAPLYWAWSDPAHLLVHSGVEGADGFVGEVGPDGASLEREVIAPGGFRAPAVTADARFRAYTSPATATPEQVIVESTDRTMRHGVGVYGTAALGFAPTGAALAFIAASASGPALDLPIGPLRLMDAASGAVRTLLADPVVAFFWSPDGSTIAALELVSPGGDGVATSGGIVLARVTDVRRPRPVPAAAPPGLALRLVFVKVASGHTASQRAVRVSDDFTQQVVPFFDQYALSHRFWSPDSASIVLPLVSDDGVVHLTIIRADGADARAVTEGAMAFWRPTP
jgi:TolB protein